VSSSGLKREIPGWVGVVVIVVILAILAVAGYRYFTASGARKPGEYPPEAYRPPGYVQPPPSPGATTGGAR